MKSSIIIQFFGFGVNLILVHYRITFLTEKNYQNYLFDKTTLMIKILTENNDYFW